MDLRRRGRRKRNNEEFHNCYYSSDINAITSGFMKSANIRKHKKKFRFGRSRSRSRLEGIAKHWEILLKIILRET